MDSELRDETAVLMAHNFPAESCEFHRRSSGSLDAGFESGGEQAPVRGTVSHITSRASFSPTDTPPIKSLSALALSTPHARLDAAAAASPLALYEHATHYGDFSNDSLLETGELSDLSVITGQMAALSSSPRSDTGSPSQHGAWPTMAHSVPAAASAASLEQRNSNTAHASAAGCHAPPSRSSSDLGVGEVSGNSEEGAVKEGGLVLPPGSHRWTSCYVKNLPPDESELSLYRLFAPIGAVQSCKVMTDPISGKCKGVGFVNYARHAEAVKAIQKLDGMRIGQGRALQVVLQAPRKVRAANAAAAKEATGTGNNAGNSNGSSCNNNNQHNHSNGHGHHSHSHNHSVSASGSCSGSLHANHHHHASHSARATSPNAQAAAHMAASNHTRQQQQQAANLDAGLPSALQFAATMGPIQLGPGQHCGNGLATNLGTMAMNGAPMMLPSQQRMLPAQHVQGLRSNLLQQLELQQQLGAGLGPNGLLGDTAHALAVLSSLQSQTMQPGVMPANGQGFNGYGYAGGRM